jgi:hypothetical protein
MVNCDQIRAHGKCSLDHHFGERCNDRGLDMAATKHGLANGHEVRDRVVAIANKLYAIRMRKLRRVQLGEVLLGGCLR